jgi:hypothetical protein
MLKARIAKEVVLKLQNDVGALDRIVKTIADKGINVLGASCWVEGGQAILRFLTEDNLRVVDALRTQGHNTREADVVLCEVAHKPGMLRRVTDRLAQGGIDVHHLYVTGTLSQDTCLLVFASANNDHAIVLLNG